MQITEDLLTSLPTGTVRDVRIGVFWTAIVTEIDGVLQCGLASTMKGGHRHGSGPEVRDAGNLVGYSAHELAGLALSESSTEASVGIAAINALLPRHPEQWTEQNAEDVIVEHGAGKNIALIGHFPFVPRIRKRARHLWVLEHRPHKDDLLAEKAPEIVPQADLLAITGTTLINHTFSQLMALRKPDATVLVLGPSTPLSPTLFEHGVHLLAGSIVEDIEAVMRTVSQGANFRQVHQHGVRLVTMHAEILKSERT